MRGGREAYIQFFSILLSDVKGHTGKRFVAYRNANSLSGAILKFQALSRIKAPERDLCKSQRTENFSVIRGYISGQRMKFKKWPLPTNR